MKRTAISIILIAALVACDKIHGSNEEPRTNEVKVELSCGEVFFYRGLSAVPVLTVTSSESSRQMEMVMRCSDHEPDTLTFESSSDTLKVSLPFSSTTLGNLAVNGKEFSVDGHVVDLVTSDTTRFSFTTLCLPYLTMPTKDQTADASSHTLRFKANPSGATEFFRYDSCSDNIEVIKFNGTSSIGNIAFKTKAVGPAEIRLVYKLNPEYKYRFPFYVTGDYTIHAGFITNAKEVDGKTFTRLSPAVFLEAANVIQKEGFPIDLVMSMIVKASGSCNWHDDSEWDNPEVKEKLTAGYHITRHDEFEISDTISVESLGFLGSTLAERRRIFDYDIEEIIYRYNNHISFTGMQTDPVNQALYPTYINPVPKHYYDCMHFQFLFEPAKDYPYLHFSVKQNTEYFTSLSDTVSSKASEEHSAGKVDAAGKSALLSWPSALDMTMAADGEDSKTQEN